MRIGRRSNCFLGAVAIRRRMGGKLDWRPGWEKPGSRLEGFLGNPWGHWRVVAPNGDILSYSTLDKNLSVWRQLWFEGYIKRRGSINENR